MKNKSFLTKLDELKPQSPAQIDIERKLLPRLKFMGYVMYAIGLSTLVFAIAAPEDPEIIIEFEQEAMATAGLAGLALESDEDILELHPKEVLNFYLVSLVFATTGTACFLTAWKKKKQLFCASQPQGETALK